MRKFAHSMINGSTTRLVLTLQDACTDTTRCIVLIAKQVNRHNNHNQWTEAHHLRPNVKYLQNQPEPCSGLPMKQEMQKKECIGKL